MSRSSLGVAILIFVVYVTAIVAGLHVRDLSRIGQGGGKPVRMAWRPPPRDSIPRGEAGELVRLGEQIFNETRLYASEHTGAKISCADCHAAGGMQPYASPMVGLPALFPMYNQRAGRMISLQDRIQECFVRSENGSPLDYKGREMKALVSYIDWLSQAHEDQRAYKGRGLVTLPVLTPDPVRGESIYRSQCAGCHGDSGEGKAPQFPALWGSRSFNDGAGMHGIAKMAAFVQHNMPQNRMGILSPQDAYDVAGFVHLQARPAFNKAYAHY